MSKIILTIPIHIWIDDNEFNTDKEVLNKFNKIKRELANYKFGCYAGSYSFQKKKCRVKDIKTV